MENGKTTQFDMDAELLKTCNHHVPRIRREHVIEVHLEDWFDNQKDGQGYVISIVPVTRQVVQTKYYCSACNKRMDKDEGRKRV